MVLREHLIGGGAGAKGSETLKQEVELGRVTNGMITPRRWGTWTRVPTRETYPEKVGGR